MSEVALAPVAAQPGQLTTARARRNRLNPLEALERGFALFRSTFAREAWRYYVGAAPLVVCFIPMWVVNGQIRLSNGVLLMEAALLTGAYLLRVLMIASYVQGVRERAFGVPRPNFSGAFARAAARGRLLAWKITLSAAALATVASVAGAPWFYGACQFAGLEAGEDASERHSLRGCLALAGQWYGGSLLLFVMFIPLWIAVWLNGFIMALVGPQLLHSIFGVDTLLSTIMGTYSLLRSSAFWLSLLAGAWLALDPIVKCTFVVVYQHLRSRREGGRLLGFLSVIHRDQRRKAEMIASAGAASRAMLVSFALLATILLVGAQTARPRGAQVPSSPTTAESAAGSTQQAAGPNQRHAREEDSHRRVYRR